METKYDRNARCMIYSIRMHLKQLKLILSECGIIDSNCGKIEIQSF